MAFDKQWLILPGLLIIIFILMALGPGVGVIGLFITLFALGILSIILWKRHKKIMYLIGGIILLVFALVMMIVFVTSTF